MDNKLNEVTKEELYEMVNWASWECEEFLKAVKDLGLAIVRKSDLDAHNQFCNYFVDDGR